MKLMRKKQQKPARRSLHVSGEGRAAPEDLAQRYAFRRNRTLTGSLSSDVVSATEQRAELRSARMQAHDLRKHRRKLSSILFIVLLIVAGLGYLIFESIALPNVEIKGLAGVETSTYEQKIQQYLGTRFFAAQPSDARYRQSRAISPGKWRARSRKCLARSIVCRTWQNDDFAYDAAPRSQLAQWRDTAICRYTRDCICEEFL